MKSMGEIKSIIVDFLRYLVDFLQEVLYIRAMGFCLNTPSYWLNSAYRRVLHTLCGQRLIIHSPNPKRLKISIFSVAMRGIA